MPTAALTKLLRNGTNYERANGEKEKWFKTNEGRKQVTHAQIAQYIIVHKIWLGRDLFLLTLTERPMCWVLGTLPYTVPWNKITREGSHVNKLKPVTGRSLKTEKYQELAVFEAGGAAGGAADSQPSCCPSAPTPSLRPLTRPVPQGCSQTTTACGRGTNSGHSSRSGNLDNAVSGDAPWAWLKGSESSP